MTALPFALEDDPLPRLGLIVLRVDETIEQDFRRLVPPHAARLHVSRVPSGDDLNPETIGTMQAALPAAAALLPPAAGFGAVGYACTSGATLIGPARVHALVAGATRTAHVTDPLTAALTAFRTLGVSRIGIVSPYIDSVAAPIRSAFEAAALTVTDTLSFGEEVEARVARIAPASIAEAARALAGRSLAGRSRPDAVFLSCTNLRTLDILEPLERELGVPVLSSNLVLAWHMARLARVALDGTGRGMLLGRG